MPPTPKDLPLVTVGRGGLFLNINNDVLLTKTIHIDCIYIVLSTKLQSLVKYHECLTQMYDCTLCVRWKDVK